MNPRNTNIIVGDFNLPKINWKTLSCPSDNFHKPFLSFLIESSCTQLINFPTCGSNILDLILTNDAHVISHINADTPCGASDHVSILFNVILTTDSTQSINNDRHCMYNWDLADYDNIGLYLSDVDW